MLFWFAFHHCGKMLMKTNLGGKSLFHLTDPRSQFITEKSVIARTQRRSLDSEPEAKNMVQGQQRSKSSCPCGTGYASEFP